MSITREVVINLDEDQLEEEDVCPGLSTVSLNRRVDVIPQPEYCAFAEAKLRQLTLDRSPLHD